MIGETKLILPPLFGVVVVFTNLLSDLPEAARTALDVAALAVLFAGVFVVGKLRTENAASKGAAEAWESERNAVVARNQRLEDEIRAQTLVIADLHVEMAKLEARPTLETVSSQIDQLRTMMAQIADGVQDVVQSHHRPLPEGG